MKLKQKMFMTIFMKIKICLILVTIHKIQSFYDPVNKKVIGKMKEEFKGKIISEFVGLKSKYSLVVADGKENKKAKGVNRDVVRVIRHKEVIDVLFGGGLMRHRMKRIKRKLHRIGTYDVCKVVLPCFDDDVL